MVSAATLHVVSTELAVGSFAVAGVAFLMAGLASHGWFFGHRHLLGRQRAHFALAFCVMPFTIITGIQSSPGEGIDHPVLINKCLASASLVFVLVPSRPTCRWTGTWRIQPALPGAGDSERSAWCVHASLGVPSAAGIVAPHLPSALRPGPADADVALRHRGRPCHRQPGVDAPKSIGVITGQPCRRFESSTDWRTRHRRQRGRREYLVPRWRRQPLRGSRSRCESC